ncbi:MAG: altronate dehydratase [Clostridia bacterium]|nr:altronate dehydratase [Clostridia bacterium]NDO19378.1 altronate dehydratase [Lachnospiraceae bacterium MD329]
MKQIKINERDNVAVQLEGELSGHKVALRDINKGENIIKYGYPIGYAISDIKQGEHIHTHNIKTNLSGVLKYEYKPQKYEIPKTAQRTFMGYRRKDGKVGIRNEIWIVNTVGCVNKTSEILAREANRLYGDMCDGIYNFVHPFGCSQLGDDQKMTQLILKGLVNHPNAAGVLVLGLGCENNNIPLFKTILGDVDTDRVKFMSTQEYDNEIDEGLRLIAELADYVKLQKREECNASELVVGLKCGGSDGFSGLTANPLIGRFSDKLIGAGGSTILTEVPEMFGAETILMNRCTDENVFNKTVTLINDFKDYFTNHNQVVYENPSPGNKKGGITTLEDKSLGCVQKSGSADVVDVLEIGKGVEKQGLNLLTGPGNDIVAVTNLTASGCHMILFSTGRGTPVGAPVPTVKISTNSDLAQRKPHWIDFNAGEIINGADLTDELFDYVLEVAGGKKTNNEKNGYREISIFKDGVVL